MSRISLYISLLPSVAVNVALVLFVLFAYQYADHIPMVVNSPSRYSNLVIPLALGGIAAAVLSFRQYLGLPSVLALLPLFGALAAGFASATFFWPFPNDRGTLIADYMERLDYVGYAILAFAIISFVCSCVRFLQLRASGADQNARSPEERSDYWSLKALACDLPVALSATIVLLIQINNDWSAHQNFTNVYFDILRSYGVVDVFMSMRARPDALAMSKLQSRFAYVDFWSGVALGVIGVQLVMQQFIAFVLEVIFLIRQHHSSGILLGSPGTSRTNLGTK